MIDNPEDAVYKEALTTFQLIKDNEYQNKQIGIAQYDGVFSCHCFFSDPCDTTCVNKGLLIECTVETCPVASECKNMRFQNKSAKRVDVIKTKYKGFGIKALEDIEAGDFVMEYIGEFINERKFDQRIKTYTNDKHSHFYGMSLRPNEYVDATLKGGIARFCNHSCDPNCQIQQWIVNGRLRMGLFAIKDIDPEEELTFDYNFERFGVPQKCHCLSSNCRGYIGQAKEDMTLVRAEEKLDLMDSATPFVKDEEIIKMMRLLIVQDPSPHEFEPSLYKLLKSDKMMHLSFINNHGLIMLKHILVKYQKEPFYSELIQFCDLLPLTRKNYLDQVGLLNTVQELAFEYASNTQLMDLLNKWNSLKTDIIITKRTIKRSAQDVANIPQITPPDTRNPTKRQKNDRSTPILIKDDTLPEKWQSFKDERGIYYLHISGKVQTRRPIDFKNNGEDSLNSPVISTPRLENIDELDVDLVFAEIEQKQLRDLKRSFEKDKAKQQSYKRLKMEVSKVVVDKLARYAPNLRLEKDMFKRHAKTVILY